MIITRRWEKESYIRIQVERMIEEKEKSLYRCKMNEVASMNDNTRTAGFLVFSTLNQHFPRALHMQSTLITLNLMNFDVRRISLYG